MNAKDVNGLGPPLREFLERLPGRIAEKQEFFNNRYHLKTRKSGYNALWEDLGALGSVPRAKYIFDYARVHLPASVRGLLADGARGKATRKAADPPIADILLYQNGKLKRLGRLLADYLPTEAGKTVAVKPVKRTPHASASSLPTVPAKDPPSLKQRVSTSDATTRTNDGDGGGWWRDQKRYTTIRRLGKGGMGFVYLVKDSRTGVERAAKVIDPGHRKDEEYQARFFREVRAQSLLHHPNILRILAHGRDFYICEVCDGTLAEHIAGPRLTQNRAIALFRQACAGVIHAHKGKVLHRDLKPSNLLLRKNGNLVVADFGLCKIDSSEFTTVTSTKVQGGTFRYAAPEQWRSMRDADARADVYSLGVVLQDLLVGSTKHDIGDRETLTRVKADPFIEVIERATAFRPEHRFASVSALASAVGRAAKPRS
ncbi:MAG: serine/threonine-protein kinase [Myxococcota bacterium]